MASAIYIACVVGALALLLLLPRQGTSFAKLGGLLGACTLGGIWLYLARFLPPGSGLEGGKPAMAFYYIFSAISIASAVTVITRKKPVYCALWFVMVVLASSGLFLLMDAEFMAFAMVIIYGGAILVTYMFVIMLASQGGDPRSEEDTPIYDRLAWEPLSAVATGFLLLAVLLTVAFKPMTPNPAGYAKGMSDQEILASVLTDRADKRLEARVGKGLPMPAAAEMAGRVTNVERVGLDLFTHHPLGLELAGVVLLVSLVGAVVIARQKVAEEEKH